VARVARAAGRTDIALRFERRARGWRQLWDAQTRTMRGKDSAGRWRTPFDPLVPTSPMNNPGDYTEANAWQYTLTPALHDPDGLVAQMGGPKKVLSAGKAAAAKGDDRWAATLLSTLVRAAPDTPGAKAALAGVYRQLAWRAEAAPWRNFYLTGAQELEEGIKPSEPASAAGIAANLTVSMLLDSMSVRLVPERAIAPMTIAFEIADAKERHLVSIGNGVMLHEKGVTDPAQATLVVPRRALIGLIGGAVKAPELMAAGQLAIKGDLAVLQRFMGLFQPPKPDFPLVAP
jgi:alkyl sulfatase BDS1-like metallo-beta-lactamase superfamily hydrolase